MGNHQNGLIGNLKSYRTFVDGIQHLLSESRRFAARSINSILVATYWETGRRIVEFEQLGESRAPYGKTLLIRLSTDLSKKLGRGFSVDNLQLMRRFYISWSNVKNYETPSRKLENPEVLYLSKKLPLSWSQYVLLMGVDDLNARSFYESESLSCGWSVSQLDRQINTQFYERTLLSKNKAAMLAKGARMKSKDSLAPEQEVKDSYVLEFLNLKDEYSESDLEEALIKHLETFLLELGDDFCFISRQKRLRIGDQWYRVDLVFFHRKLKCLIIIDLKLNQFTHSDAGQMQLYLNYAKEHWTHSGENSPIGLILCTKKNDVVAHYALGGAENKVLASEYKTKLPRIEELEKELKRSRELLDFKMKSKLARREKSGR